MPHIWLKHAVPRTKVNTMSNSHLIVLGGLPATGKSTVSSELLRQHAGIAYVRVDSIEQALRDSDEMGDSGVQGSGYLAAYAVVRDLLRSIQVVLVECVNPIASTRHAWRNVARSTGARLLEVELFCSDALEHRARAESRSVDIPGLKVPNWEQIQTREYVPWTTADLSLDTATMQQSEAATAILTALLS